MRKLRKKALALFLAAMMVVALAPAAFAGSFSDVPADNKYAGAIEWLAGLGILQGRGGGLFAPKEFVTRAEAAKIAVMLRGISSVAASETQFSDVPTDHWASGWISVATGLGLIKGRGNGTFDPEGRVTHQEWLTMLLRVMGYGPVIDNKPWPQAAIAQAAVVGLDKGLGIQAYSVPAYREEVAAAADNALTGELWGVTGYDSRGEIYGPLKNADGTAKTILDTYLKTTKVADATVTNTPRLSQGGSYLKPNEIELRYTVNNAATTKTYKVTGGINPDDYYGEKVDAYLNQDNVVVALKVKNADSVVRGTVDKYDSTNKQIVLKDGSKYDVLFDAQNNLTTTGYLNRSAITTSTLSNLAGAAVKMVLDSNGKVAYVEAWKDDDSKVVTAVDTNLQRITYFGKNVSATSGDRQTTASLKDYDLIVEKDGVRIGLGDIKPDDTVRLWEDRTNKWAYIRVASKKASGTVSSFDLANGKVTIGGTTYSVASNATLSTDNNSSSDKLDWSKMGSLVNQSVTAILNEQGKVRHLVSSVTTTQDVVGIVKTAPNDKYNPNGEVQVVKLDGTAVTYTFKDHDTYCTESWSGACNTAGTAKYAIGDVVTVSLNTDGKVTKLAQAVTSSNNIQGASKDNNWLNVGGVNYRVTSSTRFVDANYTSGTPDTVDVKVLSAADVLKAAEGWTSTPCGTAATACKSAHVKLDGATVKWVVLDAKGDTDVDVTSDKTYGVITGFTYNADGESMVLVNVNGTVNTYRDKTDSVADAVYKANNNGVGKTSYTAADKKAMIGTLIQFTVAGNDIGASPAALLESSANEKSVTVDQVDTANNAVKIKSSGTWYTLGAKSAIYDVSDVPNTAPAAISLGSLVPGWTVYVYTDDNGSNPGGTAIDPIIVVTKH